jgi:hypothetical protein
MTEVNATNGVSWGARHTVTAAEATANEVTFKLIGAESWDMVGIATVGTTVLTVSYPAKGQIKVSGTLTEDDVINFIANRSQE